VTTGAPDIADSFATATNIAVTIDAGMASYRRTRRGPGQVHAATQGSAAAEVIGK
jgi:hypothetical protein